jgi:hypothetical protein
MPGKLTPSERFWSKVNQDGPIPTHCPELGPCWIWTASRVPAGYGQFYFNHRPRGAHIFAYLLTYGDLPPDMPHVLHQCDGAAVGCVRPSHLMAGTQTSNVADMVSKGRQQRGERSGKARLTETQVREIRAKYRDGVRVKDLATEYHVVHSAISSIISRRKWGHI